MRFREIKQQATFRDAVLTAYGGRCAVSRLPEPVLLHAAHIVVDANERMGQPVVTNGLPLSKIHHAAFDAQLIGIDPDFRIHVSDRHDGPFLEQGLKAMAGRLIHLPRRTQDYPDRERLAFRFEQFRKSA
jgi:putative restriction endonuclease